MRSLSARLLVGSVISTSLILAGAGAAIYVVVRAALLDEFDESLIVRAAALASVTEVDAGRLKVEYSAEQMPQFHRGDEPEYFQIWMSNGATRRSENLPAGTELPRPASERSKLIFACSLPHGAGGRAALLRFHPRDEEGRANPNGPEVQLVIARETTELTHDLGALGLLLLGTWVTATAVSVLATRIVVRRGLQPASQIAATIARVGHADLKERLAVDGAPAELAPIAQRLNDLLARLDAAFARERAFTGNVAHELRTPLAGVKAALEVCLSGRREPAEYERVARQCLEATDLMHRMVESLLMLTRVEAGQVIARRESINIAELLRGCWLDVTACADGGDAGPHVRWDVAAGVWVAADRAMLRAALRNLLDNALHYVDDGGSIHVAASTSAHDGVRIEIANTGSRISSEEVLHVFEPFWRGDAARSDVGSHCGLGLTLSRRLLQAVGGTLSATSEVGGEFRVVVRLPVEPPGAVQEPRSHPEPLAAAAPA